MGLPDFHVSAMSLHRLGDALLDIIVHQIVHLFSSFVSVASPLICPGMAAVAFYWMVSRRSLPRLPLYVFHFFHHFVHGMKGFPDGRGRLVKSIGIHGFTYLSYFKINHTAVMKATQKTMQ
jgi:hypothetical protein